MPSKMPPGWLELRNEMALRAAIRDRFVKDANKLPFHEVRPMPPITNEAIEQARREAQFDDQGRVVMPTPKPPEIRMQAGGVLNRMKGAAKNVAGNQGLNVLMGEDNPMWYGAGIGSMAALYHSPLNEDEVEYDRMRRLYAEMDRAGMSRPTSQANPAWKNPLPQFNPQEVIANYPNWAEMPAVDKARILKNYEDYKRMAPSGHRYGGGGGVKKQAVDLARRGFMGLRGAAPVEHLPATIQPPITKSVLDAPISRRSILQSAVGQVARNALPVGEMIPSAAKAVEAVAPASPGLNAIPGLMAKLLREGKSVDEAAKIVDSMVPETIEGWSNVIGDRIADPYSMTHIGAETPVGTVFGEMIRPAHQSSVFGLRDQMRQLREMSPEDYERLKEAARDYSEFGRER